MELHSSARFARERKQAGQRAQAPGLSPFARLALVIHNLAYWFFLVPFFTTMSYETGFAVYAGILFSRFLANTWINVRGFDWQAYYRYPLRIP